MTDLADIRPDPSGHPSARGLAAPMGAFLFGRSPSGWLLPILLAYRGRILVLLCLGLIAAGLGLIPPYLTKLVIDAGLLAGDTRALIGWSAALFVVGLAAVGLGALNNIQHMRASVSMLADLRRTLLDALIGKSPGWFERQRAGELLARIDGDAGEVQQFAFNTVLGGTSSLVRLVGGTTMLMILNWKLGLAAALLAPIELLFLVWARPHTERLAGAARSARGRFTAGLSETLHGLPALQIADGTGWAQRRSLADQGLLNRRLLTQQRWGEFTRAVPQILSALMRAAIFVTGGIMVIRGDWPLGSLIAFIAYMGFMVGPMQSLLGLWHAQARAKIALARLDGLMTGPRATVTQAATHAGVDLRVENVVAGRSQASAATPLTLDIPAGTKLALNGPSGIGKTRLLSVLTGREAPASGQALLGGAPVAALPPDVRHRHIAFVSQRPFTVRGSLRDNFFLADIFWRRPDADETVWGCLEMLGLADRFRAADGLDTVLGENGLTLSGGERQRICLARALLRPFDILVLDEALSEVDAGLVRRIIGWIDSEFASKTRIITTHSAKDAYGQFDMHIDLENTGS
ncbi:ABC transporter ATP-binding protein [Ruegeria sp. MALMAid1280]|uniref:ABC transporter ATP-binding protein n=1 Tax=Ruegeria sp. MALMAid1280 TaxID=3411634 RepID=UPI003B9DE931